MCWVNVEVAVLNCSLSLPFLPFVPLSHLHASESGFLIITSKYSQSRAIDTYHSHPQSKLTQAGNIQNTPPRRVNKKGYTKTAPYPLSTHLKTLPFQSLQSPPQESREYGFIHNTGPCASVVRSLVIWIEGVYRKEEVNDNSSFNRTSHHHHHQQYNRL